MKVVVHTVPGTGTRFVCDILERVFNYKGITPPEFMVSNISNVFILIHAYQKPHHRIAEIKEGVPFVTALRHPCISFFTRQRSRSGNKETVEQCAARWHNLIKIVQERKALCFPVDVELDRAGLIMRLGAHVRAWANMEVRDSIAKYWQPVGFNGVMPEQVEYRETGSVEGCDLTPLQAAVDWYNTQVETIQ